MINMDYVFAEVQRVFAMLSPNEFPEVYEYLYSLIEDGNDDDSELDMPYTIAGSILELDKPLLFPKFLVDFITDMFELEIDEGNENAMNDLGAQYYGGSRGFQQSFKKAIHYYKMAVKNGSRQAQENLGYCYYYGRDGKPDYEKAFHCFALGAFDGHVISLYKIGDMYLNGLYVPKNEVEAAHIYLYCLEVMPEELEDRVGGPVYLRLGNLFLNGIGIPQDPKAALTCYQRAEMYFIDMIEDGDVMYKNSLKGAVEGQEKSRKMLCENLPPEEWEVND